MELHFKWHSSDADDNDLTFTFHLSLHIYLKFVFELSVFMVACDRMPLQIHVVTVVCTKVCWERNKMASVFFKLGACQHKPRCCQMTIAFAREVICVQNSRRICNWSIKSQTQKFVFRQRLLKSSSLEPVFAIRFKTMLEIRKIG